MIELLMQAQGAGSDIIANFISSLGFPVFVAVWLLWKSHKDTNIMREAINGLQDMILKLDTYIRALHDKE